MLPQLDVRHFYSVVVLAEELNFTRAAHRLRISQPALSRQITELERQYGFQLITRDRKRGAQLTEAGRMFVEEARSALLHADRAIHLARAAHHGYDNVILVGHPTHADHAWISTLLTIRLPLFPKLKVRLTTLFAMELVRSVLASELRSIPGIVLACVSLVAMPLVSRAKNRVGKELSSAAMHADARQTDFCFYLFLILLAGLLLNATLGWWWTDPLAALGMVPIVTKEGIDALKGRTSCDSC